jgi:hypothetical protein
VHRQSGHGCDSRHETPFLLRPGVRFSCFTIPDLEGFSEQGVAGCF